MKKFVYCIYLLLAACCTTAVAQTTDNLLKIAGVEPQPGNTTYYLKNVGTGLYMSYGGEHGLHCIETRAAHPILLTSNSDGTISIGSLAGYLNSNDLWMDQVQSGSKWTLVPVEGYTNQYYLQGDGGAVITSVGNSAGLLQLATLANNASQRWAFLTEEDIRNNKMPQATAEKPFDVTPFIKGAAFDLADLNGSEFYNDAETPSNMSGLPYAGNWENFLDNIALNDGQELWDEVYCIRTNDANAYNFCGIIEGTTSALTITYKMTLPAGTYSYSFEGFYEHLKMVTEQDQTRSSYNSSWANSGDSRVISKEKLSDMKATVSINGISYTLPNHGDKKEEIYQTTYTNHSIGAAAEFRDNDEYKESGNFYLSENNKEVSIVITMQAKATNETTSSSEVVTGEGTFLGFIPYDNAKTVTTTSHPFQVFVDDFTLLYYGPKNESNVDERNLFKSYLEAYIEEYIESLPEEDKESAREVIATIDTSNITSVKEFYGIIEGLREEIEKLKLKKLKEETLRGLTTDGNDYVYRDGKRVEDALVNLPNVVLAPSFEDGTLTGWKRAVTKNLVNVFKSSNYPTEGVDGTYLFYSGDGVGARLTQTIDGLPNGVYKMTASLAAGEGNTVYLIGNNERRGVTMTQGADTFEDHYIKFRVTDGTATIGVVGGDTDGAYGDTEYKCDNFRLSILNGDHLELAETATAQPEADYWYGKLTLNRTIKANGNWNTFVVPFDIPASMLDGWEVKELESSELNEQGGITLKFVDAEDGIKAGVPYMVRNQGMTEAMTEILMQDVNISTELKDVETEHVTFKGVYTKTYVPIGSYFISSNKFYRCVNESNPDYVNGYRAYIEPKESAANARSLGYRFGSRNEIEEGTTSIDNEQWTNDNEAPTVVAIYTLGGVRISDMQEGVNILQMSDGSVVKVVIK